MNQENKIEYFDGTNNLKYLSTYSKSLNKSIEIIMSDNDTINY